MIKFKTGETRGYISVKVFEGKAIIGTIMALDSKESGNNDKGFMFHSRKENYARHNYKVFKTIEDGKQYFIKQKQKERSI